MTDDNQTDEQTGAVKDTKTPWSTDQVADASTYTSDGDDSDAPVTVDETRGDVRAETVTISQGGANSIDAKNVSITQGGAGQVRAAELSVSQGGVGVARTDNLTVGEGGSAFAVMAESASVEEGGNVFMLVARSTTGEIRPVLDWRAALALGAALALVLRVLRRR